MIDHPAPAQDAMAPSGPAVSRRALLLGLAAAAAATQLAGCGTAASDTVPALLTANGVARVTPPADAPVGAAAIGMTALGYRLSRVTATSGKNWVASPLSLGYAFAMARAGASGATASQIDTVFGFPAAGRDEAFNAIGRQVATNDIPPAVSRAARHASDPPMPTVVSIGNALFTAKGLALGQPFLHTLAAQYGAGARPVDFTSAQAVAQINAWVRQATAGRITKLFDNIDASTRLVIANATYLRADWASNFVENPITTEPFTRLDGSTVAASMMSRTAPLRYASGAGWEAVELPYRGNDLAMWVILPSRGTPPDGLLAPSVLTAVGAGLRAAHVHLAMPRFDFGSDFDLVAALSTMGLTLPFGSGADFSGIAPGLHISAAIQRVNISVDEWGTVAAAVTGMAFTDALALADLSVRVDHPFAFAIVSGAQHIPLFVGQVADPTAT